MNWGEATGIPVVALRYSCTYGPRQSLFNPYTGVIAIFCTRLVNDRAPLVYEDGHQSRDMVFVEDVARANLLVATDDRADGRVFNVGTGQAAEIGDLARLLADRLGKSIEPSIPGEFRPGEMRALISDISQIEVARLSAHRHPCGRNRPLSRLDPKPRATSPTISPLPNAG